MTRRLAIALLALLALVAACERIVELSPGNGGNPDAFVDPPDAADFDAAPFDAEHDAAPDAPIDAG